MENSRVLQQTVRAWSIERAHLFSNWGEKFVTQLVCFYAESIIWREDNCSALTPMYIDANVKNSAEAFSSKIS